MDDLFMLNTRQETVRCPYCGSNSTEFFSLFGQQLLTLQYYCHTCHTPFEHVRDDDLSASQETRQQITRQEMA